MLNYFFRIFKKDFCPMFEFLINATLAFFVIISGLNFALKPSEFKSFYSTFCQILLSKGVNGARAARQGVDLLWPAIPDPLRSARPPTRYYSGTYTSINIYETK